jgi:hypothetical protein
MFQNRPALRLVLLCTAGIILAAWISLPPFSLFVLTVVFVFLSVVLFWKSKWTTLAEVSLQCSVVLLGSFLQTLQQSDFYVRELEPHVSDEPIILFGVVDSEPSQLERRISCVVSADSCIRPGKF